MKQKLLIVDDEPNIVMALEYAMRKKGYEVFVARDGSEALEILNTQTPHLVLLDIMMPNVDGYATLKHIKDRPTLADTKVVFLSAKNKEEDIAKGLELGADDYITKPFSMKKLMERVDELITDK